MDIESAKIMQKEQAVRDLLSRRRSLKEIAGELGVTRRTVYNYFRRFRQHGPEGLKDHRRGSHRKITPDEEAAILACKKESPQQSARFIRDRLGLKVSAEAVRLVLVKHGLNRKAMEITDKNALLELSKG